MTCWVVNTNTLLTRQRPLTSNYHLYQCLVFVKDTSLSETDHPSGEAARTSDERSESLGRAKRGVFEQIQVSLCSYELSITAIRPAQLVFSDTSITHVNNTTKSKSAHRCVSDRASAFNAARKCKHGKNSFIFECFNYLIVYLIK